MNNRKVINNSNWNNMNQNVKNNLNKAGINDYDDHTIHKLNTYSFENHNQIQALNIKPNQSELINEIEMTDFIENNLNNDGCNKKEILRGFKLNNEELEAIIKKGQTKLTLNSLANKMMEDLRILSSDIYETIDSLSLRFNDNTTNLLKNASDYKKKIDGLISDPTERNNNIEILKYLRDRISNKQF